jgi:glyoxylase-like metal-dependent hydrolase (beta-lactamase superfamily II)
MSAVGASARQGLDHAVPGVLATAPQVLPFGRAIEARTFLLPRESGNLLIYSTETLASSRDAIEAAGGAARQYLNHWHESIFTPEDAQAAAVPLVVHEADAAEARERTAVAEAFAGRHVAGADFEAIPTPGHTPGATAYLWTGGDHRLLFTGDSIYLREGEWIAAVLSSSDRGAYLASLELIRELEFDILVPWASAAGPPYARTDAADARRRIDAIIARVARGEDH